MKWMKTGLVGGLLVTGIALVVVGCAQQEAPAPAPEAPKTEAPAAPAATDTTMAPAAADTTMAPAAAADTTKAGKMEKKDTKKK